MKQKVPFWRFYAILACLFVVMTSAQMLESPDDWKQIAEQDAVQISYIYNNVKPEVPYVELNFVNNNGYAVDVSWQDVVTFKNDPQVRIGEETHHIILATNSADNKYKVDLTKISTVLATLVVEDFNVLNLEISKN